MKRLFLVMGVVLLGIPLTFCVTFGEDTEGVNFHFSNSDGTGTQSSASYNPQGEGSGWSQTFDSGSTLNADGSWSVPLSDADGNGITVRSQPVYGSDD